MISRLKTALYSRAFLHWHVTLSALEIFSLCERPNVRYKPNIIIIIIIRFSFWTKRPVDELTRGGPLPMGGPLSSCVCTEMKIWRLKRWTHGRTLRWFYTLSNAMHCIRQTKISCRWQGSSLTPKWLKHLKPVYVGYRLQSKNNSRR